VFGNFSSLFYLLQDENGSPSEVQAFYKKHRIPLVGHFSKENEQIFEKRPLVIVFYDVNFSPTYKSSEILILALFLLLIIMMIN